ncbi:hypothetical protein [Brevibacterium yomogidense]|uniref:hypothetical protein n=1 Tax=Brevibacterium yomogidense TaxID=946573 RepID=UPI0018DF2E73|nr:hypothetical protein [Brevibacterium yomogidense]
MKRILPGLAICAALAAVVGCQQGTELDSDPTPLEIEAPEMDPDAAASASATASAQAEAADQKAAENAVGVSGTLRLSDTESAVISAVTNMFDAQPADGGITVTARSTVTLENRSLTGDLPSGAFPEPAAAVVPLWRADSPVCGIAGGDEDQRVVEEIGDGSDGGADAIGCHGVVPVLGVTQDIENEERGTMGAVESVPAVTGEEAIPVDEDVDALVDAMARPDGWALVTTVDVENAVGSHVYLNASCDLVGSALGASGSATVLSTEELPGCG